MTQRDDETRQSRATHPQPIDTMADQNSAGKRLTQLKDILTLNKTATTIPWDPNCTIFPTRKELPEIPGAPAEAAWTWGESDYVRSHLLRYRRASM
jgi:hypothetical protein